MELLYTNKLYNLDEMDKLLGPHNLPRLNHGKSENMSRPVTSKESDSVIKYLPTKKNAGPDGVTGKFCMFEEELILVLPRLF